MITVEQTNAAAYVAAGADAVAVRDAAAWNVYVAAEAADNAGAAAYTARVTADADYAARAAAWAVACEARDNAWATYDAL